MWVFPQNYPPTSPTPQLSSGLTALAPDYENPGRRQDWLLSGFTPASEGKKRERCFRQQAAAHPQGAGSCRTSLALQDPPRPANLQLYHPRDPRDVCGAAEGQEAGTGI